MATTKINGIKLFYEVTADAGETLVFVHGSWVDHHSWDLVGPLLSPRFRILTYDRRGHGQSERLTTQGYAIEDASDLEYLIEEFGRLPVHVIGNSFGGSIVLKLAASRPDLFKSVAVHEPPLFGLLDPTVLAQIAPRVEAVLELLRKNDLGNAAITFVETVALGPGMWNQLTSEMQETFVFNATTWLDEQNDPDWLTVDLDALANFNHPVQFTIGDQSPPFFRSIIQKLRATIKNARLVTIPGAGHIPQRTHPQEYSELIREFVLLEFLDAG
jgi:pimeloyl-ACP methyl ester carboxylesterase